MPSHSPCRRFSCSWLASQSPGWPSGTAKDSQDALKFAAANGVRPMIETFPLERAADAYEHMISGKVRFRSVLKI